jgi:hypothetical protein
MANTAVMVNTLILSLVYPGNFSLAAAARCAILMTAFQSRIDSLSRESVYPDIGQRGRNGRLVRPMMPWRIN